MAIVPSPDSATDHPNSSPPLPSSAASFVRCVGVSAVVVWSGSLPGGEMIVSVSVVVVGVGVDSEVVDVETDDVGVDSEVVDVETDDVGVDSEVVDVETDDVDVDSEVVVGAGGSDVGVSVAVGVRTEVVVSVVRSCGVVSPPGVVSLVVVAGSESPEHPARPPMPTAPHTRKKYRRDAVTINTVPVNGDKYFDPLSPAS
jgi:hypothetical protein